VQPPLDLEATEILRDQITEEAQQPEVLEVAQEQLVHGVQLVLTEIGLTEQAGARGLRRVVIVLQEVTNTTEITHHVAVRIEEELVQAQLGLQLQEPHRIEVRVAELEVLAPIAEALDPLHQVVALVQEVAVTVLQAEAQEVLVATVVLVAAQGVLEVTVAQAVVLQDHLADLQVEVDLQVEEDSRFTNIKNV